MGGTDGKEVCAEMFRLRAVEAPRKPFYVSNGIYTYYKRIESIIGCVNSVFICYLGIILAY